MSIIKLSSVVSSFEFLTCIALITSLHYLLVEKKSSLRQRCDYYCLICDNHSMKVASLGWLMDAAVCASIFFSPCVNVYAALMIFAPRQDGNQHWDRWFISHYTINARTLWRWKDARERFSLDGEFTICCAYLYVFVYFSKECWPSAVACASRTHVQALLPRRKLREFWKYRRNTRQLLMKFL